MSEETSVVVAPLPLQYFVLVFVWILTLVCLATVAAHLTVVCQYLCYGYGKRKFDNLEEEHKSESDPPYEPPV